MANWRKNLTNIPPTVKTLTSTLGIVSIFGVINRIKWPAGSNFASDVLPNLAVVPGVAITRFWTFLTAGFLETNFIIFIIDVLVLIGCARYLERIWGSKEFLKFVMITIVGANLLTYITYLIEYYIRDDTYYLFEVQCNGLIGLVCGFLVGYKQLDPEHLMFRHTLSIRSKHFPSLFIVGSLITCIMFDAQTQFLLVIYGWIISWVYLRFFKMEDGIKGDSSETFSFASFFPEFIQPLIKVISRIVFNILVLLRCCKSRPKRRFRYDLESPNFQNLIPSMPGSARAEAERRRELALKALDKRLNSSNKNIYYPISPQKSFFNQSHSQFSSQSPTLQDKSSSLPSSPNTNSDVSNNSKTDNTASNSSSTNNDKTNPLSSTVLFDSKDYSSDL